MNANVYNWCKKHPVLQVIVTSNRKDPNGIDEVYIRPVPTYTLCPDCERCRGWIKKKWTINPEPTLFPDAPKLHPTQRKPRAEARPHMDRLPSQECSGEEVSSEHGARGSACGSEDRGRDDAVARRAAGTLMPWGKYKGVALADIPVHYLDWLTGAEFMSKAPVNSSNANLLNLILIHLQTDREIEWGALSDDQVRHDTEQD